jgi:hypothetical protein
MSKGRVHQLSVCTGRVASSISPDLIYDRHSHAAEQREKLGEGKPETFDFLGFMHF